MCFMRTLQRISLQATTRPIRPVQQGYQETVPPPMAMALPAPDWRQASGTMLWESLEWHGPPRSNRFVSGLALIGPRMPGSAMPSLGRATMAPTSSPTHGAEERPLLQSRTPSSTHSIPVEADWVAFWSLPVATIMPGFPSRQPITRRSPSAPVVPAMSVRILLPVMERTGGDRTSEPSKRSWHPEY